MVTKVIDEKLLSRARIAHSIMCSKRTQNGAPYAASQWEIQDWVAGEMLPENHSLKQLNQERKKFRELRVISYLERANAIYKTESANGLYLPFPEKEI